MVVDVTLKQPSEREMYGDYIVDSLAAEKWRLS